MLLELPSPELQVRLLKHFNENPETRGRDVRIIKDWLLEQPHLPNAWENEDKRILNFLRSSKFSLETCKEKLDNYFTARTLYPEFFANRDVTLPELQAIIKIGHCAVLPKLTPEGGRIIVGRTAVQDFDTPNLEDAVKLLLMGAEIRMELEEFGTFADVYIVDMSNVHLAKHFLNVSPFFIRSLIFRLLRVQKGYPGEISQVHFINSPPFLETARSFVSPFLSRELRSAIRVHTGVETLYDFIPRDILPEDYGGKGAKLVEYKEQWLKALEEYSPWFKAQEDVKSDESKRSKKTFTFHRLLAKL